MSEPTPKRDYSETLFLPQTEFPMRAGLPQKEPEILARWEKTGLYKQLRDASKGREKFILHDGPPYANGNIHIGHALNKILKDVVTRSQQMLGYDSNYVPGWDCHGLPIEWKIEEEYRAKGKNKDAVPVVEFRKQCRDFAQHWIGVQKAEFMSLGVEGDNGERGRLMGVRGAAEIHPFLQRLLAQHTTERVAGDPCHQRRGGAQPGQSDGHVVGAAPRPGHEAVRAGTGHQVHERLADHGDPAGAHRSDATSGWGANPPEPSATAFTELFTEYLEADLGDALGRAPSNDPYTGITPPR